MIRFFLITSIVFFCLSIFSCTNETTVIQNALKGSWAIDTIFYKNYNVKGCLGLNMLVFDGKGNISLPNGSIVCDSLLKQSNDDKGEVKVIKSSNLIDTIPFRLKINTENELFSGNHEIVFYKDKTNYLFKLELYSDDIYIMCHKILFDYSKNRKLMDKAENLTWITRP